MVLYKLINDRNRGFLRVADIETSSLSLRLMSESETLNVSRGVSQERE